MQGIGLTKEKYEDWFLSRCSLQVMVKLHPMKKMTNYDYNLNGKKILDSNGLGKEHFGDDFFNLIGDILYDIMDEQLNDGKFTICQQRKRLREQLSHT